MRFTLTPTQRATLKAKADEAYSLSDHLTPPQHICVMWDLAALLKHLGESMPLFTCEECNCIENTALCSYWIRRRNNLSALCSACDPDIKQWHGEFSQRPATGMQIDQNGHLWSKMLIDAGELPKGYTIVGEVP